MGFCRSDRREDKMYVQQRERELQQCPHAGKRGQILREGVAFPGVWRIHSQEQGGRVRVRAQKGLQLWWCSLSGAFSMKREWGRSCAVGGEGRCDTAIPERREGEGWRAISLKGLTTWWCVYLQPHSGLQGRCGGGGGGGGGKVNLKTQGGGSMRKKEKGKGG